MKLLTKSYLFEYYIDVDKNLHKKHLFFHILIIFLQTAKNMFFADIII